MEREFVSYEVASELKELGFDESCFAWYGKGRFPSILEHHIIFTGSKTYMREEDCNAPIFSQAFKFFREKYKLPSWVYTSDNEKFYFGILRDTRFLIDGNKPYDTYEEAELACLLKLIEVVKNKKWI